jgi:hypothetical protein
MKNYLTLFVLLLAFSITSLANHGPRIQILHNAPNDFYANIDIWFTLENYPLGPFKIDSSLSYKEATLFNQFTLIYGAVTFYITSGGGSDTSNYLLKQTFGSPQIDYEEFFVIVLSEGSNNNLEMNLSYAALQGSNLNSTGTRFYHGSFDTPDLNLAELGVFNGFFIDNLSNKKSTNQLNIASIDHEIQLQNTNGLSLAEFTVPFNFYQNRAIFIALTGYFDTVGVTPNLPLKLLLVQEDGSVLELFPNQDFSPSSVQLIHNSADPALEVVDVWLNDILLIDDLNFRTSTPYFEVPGAEKLTISIKNSSSINPDNPIWTQDYVLTSDQSYVLVADGLFSAAGFSNFKPFDVAVYGSAQVEAKNSQNTDLLFHHGVTDALALDLFKLEVDKSETQLLDKIGYFEFSDYLQLKTLDYIISMRSDTSNNLIEQFEIPMSTLQLNAEAITVVASGFYNPADNNNGAAFGLWASRVSGGNLIELEKVITTTTVQDYMFNSIEKIVYPNPATNFINIDFSSFANSDVELFIYNLSGQVVKAVSYGIIESGDFNTQLNISDLNKGLYLVSIHSGESIITSKVHLVK